MNVKEKDRRKRRLLRTINHYSLSGNKEGYVKIYSNNTYIHELIKFQIAYKLKTQGYDIYSEVKFNNGKRADLVAISPGSDGYIVEVLNSEKEASYEEKLNSYPIEWIMKKVYCKGFDLDKFDL